MRLLLWNRRRLLGTPGFGDMRMADIFVSYRRGDSAGHTGRLVDSLERHFGRDAVFQDVQSIAAGRRWDDVIRDGVSTCRVLVAVIGRDWLTTAAEGTRRLDDAEDHLRREITTALARDIPVIPVLVDGAPMPAAQQLPDDLKPLARWQAHELTDSRWEYDTGRLMTMIERTAGIAPAIAGRQAQAQPGPARDRRRAVAAAGTAAVVAAIAWFAWPTSTSEGITPSEPSGGTAPTPTLAPTPAAEIAPVRFDGDWYDEEATHWSIQVRQDKVEINHTAPGTGTAIGHAQGTISDRTISFEYVVMVPEEPRLNGQLVLSDDGTRLTGVLSDMANGGNTRVVLHRRTG